MAELPDWLPDLIRLEDYDGDWQRYEDAIYSKFYTDFIASKLTFQGLPVRITKNLIKAKERGFWHLIQEGNVEDLRTPDIRRCERIAWSKAIIQHSESPMVKIWSNERRGRTRYILWLEIADFLVILEKRKSVFFLWTAYSVSGGKKKEKLRREYKLFIKSQRRP